MTRPPLVEASRHYRTTLIVTPIVGLAGLVVALVLGHPVAGVTFCVGIAMGFVNSRMVIGSLARFAKSEKPNKRALTLGVLQRLAALTAIGLLIAYAFRPDGIAVLVGLALFQIMTLGSTSASLMRELRG